MLLPSNTPDADVTQQGRWLNLSARSVRRQLLVLLAVTMLAGATAGVLTWLQPTRYVSTVTVVVPVQTGANDAETTIRSVRALLSSVVVGSDLKSVTGTTLTPEQIIHRISATRPPGSSVLTVSVTDRSESTSRAVAAALLPVFARRLAEISQPSRGPALPNFSIRGWGSGTVTTDKAAPAVLRNTLVGVGLGMLLGIMLVALRLQRRPLLTSAEQAEAALGVPVLAAIPSVGRRSRGSWNRTDAVQLALRNGGQLGWALNARSIAIASPNHDHAQREVALSLARALAADGYNVTIVDADLERRTVSSMLGGGGRRGLTELLKAGSPSPLPTTELVDISFRRDKSLEGSDSVGRIRLLPAGRDRNAYGALRNAPLRKIVERLSSDAFVIVSAPRIPGPVPAGQVLQSVEAVLLVATLRDATVDDACATADAVRALAEGRPVAALLTGGQRAQWAQTSASQSDAELLLA